MNSYCLKCKLKTNTIDVIEKISKNGMNMTSETCELCESKKSVFVSAKSEKIGGCVPCDGKKN